MAITSIASEKSRPAGGHYSPGIVHNGLLYVSGQLPFDPEGQGRELKDIETQIRNCLRGVELILEAAGSDMSKMIKTTVYLADMTDWDIVNEVYKDVFGEHKPARAVVSSPNLHFGCGVEIDAIAAV